MFHFIDKEMKKEGIFKGRKGHSSYSTVPLRLKYSEEADQEKQYVCGTALWAHLPQSSCPFLLVNANEVAYHPSLNGAVLCLHSDLQIMKNNVRRKLAHSPTPPLKT